MSDTICLAEDEALTKVEAEFVSLAAVGVAK
jgi:hypothetical protein